MTFAGYSLGGADAARYALATPCCGPRVNTTSASITASGSAPSPTPTPGSGPPTSTLLPVVVFGVIFPTNSPFSTSVAGNVNSVQAGAAGAVASAVAGAISAGQSTPGAVFSAERDRSAEDDFPVRGGLTNTGLPVALNVVRGPVPTLVVQPVAMPGASRASTAPQVAPALPKRYVAPAYPRKQDRQ